RLQSKRCEDLRASTIALPIPKCEQESRRCPWAHEPQRRRTIRRRGRPARLARQTLLRRYGDQTLAASSAVSCAAGTSLHPLAFWPNHRGEKSPLPRLSALARNGATGPAASGNAGAASLIGPTSRISRFMIP